MGWSASPSVGLLVALVVEVFCWVAGLSAVLLGVSVVLGEDRERVEVVSSFLSVTGFSSLVEVPLAMPMEDGGVAVVSTVLGSMVLESMVLGSMMLESMVLGLTRDGEEVLSSSVSVIRLMAGLSPLVAVPLAMSMEEEGVELVSSLRLVIPAAEAGSSYLALPVPETPVIPAGAKEVAGSVWDSNLSDGRGGRVSLWALVESSCMEMADGANLAGPAGLEGWAGVRS